MELLEHPFIAAVPENDFHVSRSALTVTTWRHAWSRVLLEKLTVAQLAI